MSWWYSSHLCHKRIAVAADAAADANASVDDAAATVTAVPTCKVFQAVLRDISEVTPSTESPREVTKVPLITARVCKINP